MLRPPAPTYVVYGFNGKQWFYYDHTKRKTDLQKLKIAAKQEAFNDFGHDSASAKSFKLVPVS